MSMCCSVAVLPDHWRPCIDGAYLRNKASPPPPPPPPPPPRPPAWWRTGKSSQNDGGSVQGEICLLFRLFPRKGPRALHQGPRPNLCRQNARSSNFRRAKTRVILGRAPPTCQVRARASSLSGACSSLHEYIYIYTSIVTRIGKARAPFRKR